MLTYHNQGEGWFADRTSLWSRLRRWAIWVGGWERARGGWRVSGCPNCAAEREAREKAEAEKNAALQRAWRAEATATQKVGMRREFETLLGVEDTCDDGTFEKGLARLKEALAAESRLARAVEALRGVRDELGVPQPGYPAPVANAVEIARAALKEVEE